MTRSNPEAGKTTARLQPPAEGVEAVIPYLVEINRIMADLVRDNETFAALMSARGDRISRLNQQNQDNVDRIMGIGAEA